MWHLCNCDFLSYAVYLYFDSVHFILKSCFIIVNHATLCLQQSVRPTCMITQHSWCFPVWALDPSRNQHEPIIWAAPLQKQSVRGSLCHQLCHSNTMEVIWMNMVRLFPKVDPIMSLFLIVYPLMIGNNITIVDNGDCVTWWCCSQHCRFFVPYKLFNHY